MELIAVLEPYRKEFNLDSLIKNITNLEKDELHRGLNDSVDTLKVVNSALCRQWYREENSHKKNTLYMEIKKYYKHLENWKWSEYLLKPPFFNYAEFPYVSYEENKVYCLEREKA